MKVPIAITTLNF